MTTKDLEFRTLPGLWQEYANMARTLAFQPRTPAENGAWQGHLRKKSSAYWADFRWGLVIYPHSF